MHKQHQNHQYIHHHSQQHQQAHATTATLENNEREPGTSAAAITPPNTLPLNQNYAASDTSGDNDPDYPDSRYECAICIHWLNEPVLTSCGHRFCKSCLNDWFRNHNQCCPLDNKKLSADHDIFPDNYTRREIEQIKFKCPNSPLGCAVVASPIEVDRHLPTCPYRRQQEQEEKCPFASIKCDFVGRPETNALEEHLKTDMPHHMQLMLQAFQQTAVSTWQPEKHSTSSSSSGAAKTTENGHGGSSLPPPPPQYANEADEQIVQAMYQRIVVLEQRTREQEAKLEHLSRQLNGIRLDPRYSNGTIVWEVNNFTKMIEHLRANANNKVYSHECYTSPYGYKFCARIDIQPRKPHMLSLHVHLMQSENDFHLDWPFKGRIKLCMVHPQDGNKSQHDTIMTKPEVQAFHQPRERISTRGFGFLEYANISDVMMLGFCADDRLIIKIQINIV